MKTSGISIGMAVVAYLCLGLAGVGLTGMPLTAGAQGIQVIYTFNTNNGPVGPGGTLVVGPDGALYGTSNGGGTNGAGTVFKVTTNGVLAVLHNFSAIPGGSLTNYEGGYPHAGVTFGVDGNIYGTTAEGGVNGYGTVYQLLADGSACVPLHTFAAQTSGPGRDGGNPLGPLVVLPDGGLMGTTVAYGGFGFGDVFEVTTNGGYSEIYPFRGISGVDPGQVADGAGPWSGLVRGPDGYYYGTTTGGGNANSGSVYKLIPGGYNSYRQVYAFSGGSTGYDPVDNLAVGADGDLYGTTLGGVSSGSGTVFRITTGGAFASLYLFTNGTDGGKPYAGLLAAPDGNLYGTAYNGGTNDAGTIFQVATNGMVTPLFSFATTNGAHPYAGLTLGPDGYLYGLTVNGGTNNAGVVFRVVLPGYPGWCPRLLYAMPGADGGVMVTAANLPGSTNRLLASGDLSLPAGQWQVMGTNVADGGGSMQFTDTNQAGVRFYRLVAP